MVATWAKAVSRYGRLSLATDLQPAIDVAQRGFRIDADFCQLEQSDLPELRAYTASRKLFLTPRRQPAAGRVCAAQPRPGQLKRA